jgi:hypothetical protein
LIPGKVSFLKAFEDQLKIHGLGTAGDTFVEIAQKSYFSRGFK